MHVPPTPSFTGTVRRTDYSVTQSRLRVNRCEKIDCLEILLEDDDVLEDMEYFTVSLERGHGVNNKFRLQELEKNVTIADMDGMFNTHTHTHTM